jgi:hypothetical protein
MLKENKAARDCSFLIPYIEHLRHICTEEEDEILLSDLIEGDPNLDRFVGQVVQSILDDEAAVDGIKGHLKRITERRRRLEARSARLRTLLASVVTTLPNRKYRHALATLSAFDVDPRVIVQDESAIPTAFWLPQDPKLDESGLRRHLLEREKRLGEVAAYITEEEKRAIRDLVDRDYPDVPGAILGNGEVSVRIRVA